MVICGPDLAKIGGPVSAKNVQNTPFLTTLINEKVSVFVAKCSSDRSCGARCVQKVFICVVPSLIFPTTPWSLHAGTRQRPNGSFGHLAATVEQKGARKGPRPFGRAQGQAGGGAGAPGPWALGCRFPTKMTFSVFHGHGCRWKDPSDLSSTRPKTRHGDVN